MISCGASSISATARSRSRSSVILKPASWARAAIGEVERLLDQAFEIDDATFAAGTTRMFQHALDDAISAASVLGDLFEIAGQHRYCFVNLGTLAGVEGSDRLRRRFLQLVQQLDRETGEIVDEVERVLDLVSDQAGLRTFQNLPSRPRNR